MLAAAGEQAPFTQDGADANSAPLAATFETGQTSTTSSEWSASMPMAKSRRKRTACDGIMAIRSLEQTNLSLGLKTFDEDFRLAHLASQPRQSSPDRLPAA